jgi:plasmid segregation protein ParM
MKKNYIFPSVFEESNVDLFNVAEDFLNGMRITDYEGKSYIVGDLALAEGSAPHKFLNSSAKDLDYRILSLVALTLATQGKFFQFQVTTGFPFATYQSYKQGAIDFLNKVHQISIDTRTFGGQAPEKVTVNVDQVDVMTEIEGCIKAIRDGDLHEKENFFVVSLGYGTFEAALSTSSSGFINRTAVSARGISYAVNVLEKDLQKKYYISLITEPQMERAFQRGVMMADRKKIDLNEMRGRALEIYYNEVISPALRKKFSNSDFMDTSKLYLTGGGAYYAELVDLFKKEFDGVVEVIVFPEPHMCASIGYCLNSLQKSKINSESQRNDYTAFIGLDLGNSNTVVVVETKDEKQSIPPVVSVEPPQETEQPEA